jgi:beta-glucosidase
MTTPLDLPTLMDQLTTEEKASLVSGSGFWFTTPIDRLGIPSIMVTDGPHGLRKQPSAGDHVGLGDSVPATCFPTASTLGSTWDPDLVREVGAAIGREARTQGVAVVLGPGINIKRSPLCGRNFEYLSEDPLVSGVLGAAMVDGIQSQGVGTSLKHFAANNQETDRLRVSAEVDDRTLREIYLAGFEYVVRTAHPWTLMCSYNRINGVYASQDPWLLTALLRGEWGFDGLVMSDWGAVDDPVAAVSAGLDLEMPSSNGSGRARLLDALGAGLLDAETLDVSVRRVLELVDRALVGRGDDGAPPATDGGASVPDTDAHHDDAHHDDAHHRLARRAAAEGAVLLTNDGVLPLHLDTGRLVVIGEFARTPRFQGAGSSKVNPTRVDDALSALRRDVAAGVTVDFAPGYGVDDPDADAPRLAAEAVALATGAEAVVVVLGLPPSFESEGYDRAHLHLPAEQVALLGAVREVHDRVVVVLANGGVVETAGWDHHAASVLEAWLGGQAGGAAVADLLLGRANPCGRLAETVPLRSADAPAYLNFPGEEGRVVYGEGVFVGYRGYDAVGRSVAYPFGHGLSYTTFGYEDLEVVPVTGEPGDPHLAWRGAPRFRVTVRVTNTGPVAGKEVVQLYVGSGGGVVADPDTSDPAADPPRGPAEVVQSRPVRELRGFAKVALEPGASEVVAFTIDDRDLSTWSRRSDGWVVRPGRYEVAVGASSRDLRLRSTVTVGGPAPVTTLDRSSTLGEWLAHPRGHDLLVDALRTGPGGDLTGLLGDAETVRMLGSFPLVRLEAMLGGLVAPGFVGGLLGRVTEGSGGDAEHLTGGASGPVSGDGDRRP